MVKPPSSKKIKRDIQQGRYKKRKLVIGGLTVESRKKELKRQIEIWKKEGWIFQESDHRCLVAKFLVPKDVSEKKSPAKPWTLKKKLFIWAIVMWLLVGYVLMQTETERSKNTPLDTNTKSSQNLDDE
ncbi:MAG: hypothetical protein GY786_22745 [Proteobacteria bacterium]|nr:hypothetical protein [Pseudomonadota bacterium]